MERVVIARDVEKLLKGMEHPVRPNPQWPEFLDDIVAPSPELDWFLENMPDLWVEWVDVFYTRDHFFRLSTVQEHDSIPLQEFAEQLLKESLHGKET